MNHLPFLLESGPELGLLSCGHALMASCPPRSYPDIQPSEPFGYKNVPGGDKADIKTWEASKGDLAILLDLSKQLDLGGEVTPIQAWGMISAHPEFSRLSPGAVKQLRDELGRRVRCYGYASTHSKSATTVSQIGLR